MSSAIEQGQKINPTAEWKQAVNVTPEDLNRMAGIVSGDGRANWQDIPYIITTGNDGKAQERHFSPKVYSGDLKCGQNRLQVIFKEDEGNNRVTAVSLTTPGINGGCEMQSLKDAAVCLDGETVLFVKPGTNGQSGNEITLFTLTRDSLTFNSVPLETK